MKKGRRWLYLVLAAGLIAIGAGGGTFASFNAQTTNPTNAFSTGSLVLTDSHNACTSSSGTNNAAQCAGILTVDTAPFAESDSVAFKTVTLKNKGSLTASDFYLAAADQTGSKECVTSKAAGLTVGTLNKTKDLCSSLVLFVEEIGQTGASSTTYTYCWWGNSSDSGATCAASGNLKTALTEGTSTTALKIAKLTGTVATGESVVVTTGSHTETFTASAPVTAGSTKSISVTPKTANYSYGTSSDVVDVSQLTASQTVSAFDTAHASPTTGLRLLPLTASGTTGPATTAPDLEASASRTFLVGLYLPTLTNGYQALSAKFAVTWRITQ